MTDLERFNLIDEVRRVCDQQECTYAGESWTRENLEWVFGNAKRWIRLIEAIETAEHDG
jgi:hypothetical protein